MNPEATVDLPGLSITNEYFPEGAPLLTDLEGWYSTPDKKNDFEERADQDGTFDSGEPRRRARYVTVTAEFAHLDVPEAFALRKQLVALENLTSPFPVGVTDYEGRKECTVRLAGIIDFDWNTRTLQVPLIAKDPRKYGPAVPVSTGLPVPGTGIVYPIEYPLDYGQPAGDGRVTAINTGGASSYAPLEVTGGLELGFSLVEVGTGREIRFERVVPVGSTVYLNPRTGRAWLDAPENDVSGFLTRADWYAIPAGGESVIQFNAIGAVTGGTPTLTARPAPADL